MIGVHRNPRTSGMSHIISCAALLFCIMLAIMLSIMLAVTGVAGAAEKRPAAPDFSPMRPLVGTWRCTGQGEGNVIHTSTTTYALALSGRWLRVYTTSPPYASRSWFLEADGYVTHDRDHKQWLAFFFANEGDYTALHSHGWRGNQIVWHDGPPPRFDDYRETLQLTSATQYRMILRQRDDAGSLQIVAAGVCRKKR